MRLNGFVYVVFGGLMLSSLAYRHLMQTASYGQMAGWSDGQQRMTNQHAVVQTVGEVARAPRETEAAAVPQMLPDTSPPPPPPEHSRTAAAAATTPPTKSSDASSASSSSRPAAAAAAAAVPDWMQPEHNFLSFNEHAKASLAGVKPQGTTLHFTFGSGVMMDFVKNWVHFVREAKLDPFLIGAADLGLLKACNELGLPTAGIDPDLDVWTYKRKPKTSEVYEMKSEWKYFRHHNSDFLEMGLVKVAFLWEILQIGFHVLISDLDVVWLNDHWQRWMTWADAARPPVPEAAYIALADVLVTTDELSTERDAQGGRVGGGHLELNTGVVYFRNTLGGKAMVQTWRKSMLSQKGRKDLTENVNDQSLFNQVVRGGVVQGSSLNEWHHELERAGMLQGPAARAFEGVPSNARAVHATYGTHPPCLPTESCEPVKFTFGTLPMRPFTGGHTWFNQNVQDMEGHHLPQNEPITVHFTFQFGDTGDYPHGKRQRAREAALWAVDPPSYFTEGVFVAIVGPTTTPAYQEAVYKRFPEWSPQRHMFMDAPQRQAVRDILGLATAIDGVMVMPKFYCHCDRYWGFLSKCRMPMVPNMRLPFNCPMDSLYETPRWNKKNVKFREHTFLSNPNVPEELKANTVRVTVALPGVAPRFAPGTNRSHVELPYGTRYSDVKQHVLKANPAVRVIEIENADLRRLCRWLGSRQANVEFNKLSLYVLTESSRYCPQEDMGGYGAPGFDWQNPFTAYNCTWGFHSPQPFPEDDAACAPERVLAPGAGPGHDGVQLAERSNSTTCPRQMLCDYNTLPDGRVTKPITFCNIEGYNGLDHRWLGATKAMLAQMPGGRCPYPPGDRPGMIGFNSRGHYVGGDETGAPNHRWGF